MVSRLFIRVSALLIAAMALQACGAPAGVPESVDLLAELPAAEKRAGSDVQTAIREADVSDGVDTRRALRLTVPARVTWRVDLPIHAVLQTAAMHLPDGSPGAWMRVGIADDRTYEDMTRVEPGRRWQPMAVDLRRFSEWKFSLFYQPRWQSWKIVVNAEGAAGTVIALASPVLTRS